MKVCLFGGSFDPVHEGHLAIAAEAQRLCALDQVVFLPAARSPFKEEGSLFFTDEQRLAMLREAVRGMPWAVVSDLDMRLPAPSWSWRVVEACLAERPGDELFWLLGTDQWELLHLWARPDFLAQHLTFIVYHRGRAPEPRPGVRSIFLSGAEHPASSSVIRAHLTSRSPLPPAWLPPGVEKLARLYTGAVDDEF